MGIRGPWVHLFIHPFVKSFCTVFTCCYLVLSNNQNTKLNKTKVRGLRILQSSRRQPSRHGGLYYEDEGKIHSSRLARGSRGRRPESQQLRKILLVASDANTGAAKPSTVELIVTNLTESCHHESWMQVLPPSCSISTFVLYAVNTPMSPLSPHVLNKGKRTTKQRKIENQRKKDTNDSAFVSILDLLNV